MAPIGKKSTQNQGSTYNVKDSNNFSFYFLQASDLPAVRKPEARKERHVLGSSRPGFHEPPKMSNEEFSSNANFKSLGFQQERNAVIKSRSRFYNAKDRNTFYFFPRQAIYQLFESQRPEKKDMTSDPPDLGSMNLQKRMTMKNPASNI